MHWSRPCRVVRARLVLARIPAIGAPAAYGAGVAVEQGLLASRILLVLILSWTVSTRVGLEVPPLTTRSIRWSGSAIRGGFRYVGSPRKGTVRLAPRPRTAWHAESRNDLLRDVFDLSRGRRGTGVGPAIPLVCQGRHPRARCPAPWPPRARWLQSAPDEDLQAIWRSTGDSVPELSGLLHRPRSGRPAPPMDRRSTCGLCPWTLVPEGLARMGRRA